jgi:hypothetical protein
MEDGFEGMWTEVEATCSKLLSPICRVESGDMVVIRAATSPPPPRLNHPLILLCTKRHNTSSSSLFSYSVSLDTYSRGCQMNKKPLRC